MKKYGKPCTQKVKMAAKKKVTSKPKKKYGRAS